MAKRAKNLAARGVANARSSSGSETPSEAQRMTSVRLPLDRHNLLKSACVSADVPIRSLVLAVVAEIEADSDIARTLLDAAGDIDI